MKKFLYSVLCGALVVTLFTACGGGSSSSAGSSTGKADSPASEVEGIIADNKAADSEMQQKLAELAKAKNPDLEKLTKMAEEKEQLDKNGEAKLDAAAKKLVGMELPYELSGGLFYSIVSPLTVTEARANGKEAIDASISFRIKINAPLTIAKRAGMDYPIYCKYVDAGGNVVGASLINPFVPEDREAIELAADQVWDKELKLSYDLHRYTGARKVIFISKEEYDTLKK